MEDVTEGWENRVVLYLVQALLGLVSSTMRAISVEVYPSLVVIHIAAHSHSEELDEDLSDIRFELEALFEKSAPHINTNVHVGPPDSNWPGRNFRPVYREK